MFNGFTDYTNPNEYLTVTLLKLLSISIGVDFIFAMSQDCGISDMNRRAAVHRQQAFLRF